jgi:CelD/BcsL family acetyltransferase involved in cellulose biosynthesis
LRSTARIVVAAELGALIADWNGLALRSGSPFLTYEWLTCWWSAFGRGKPTWLLLHAEDGSLQGGAFLQRRGARSLAAAANVHSGDWDVLAGDEPARAQLWEAVAKLGADRIHLHAVPSWNDSAWLARGHLQRVGYRVVHQPGPESPWLALPSSWEHLMSAVSRGLRGQVGRRRRALEGLGSLQLRVITGGQSLDRDLDLFLKLEASGWKGRLGTAILCGTDTERLYRGFAHSAAAQGWLRLYLLELDGQTIAADYGCGFGGTGFLIKTTFSEEHGRRSPGLVLRAAVLRSSIEEGLHAYDFLGDADGYKRRWTSEVRPHTSIWGYRGAFLPGYAYRSKLRPLLKAARDRTRRLRSE